MNTAVETTPAPFFTVTVDTDLTAVPDSFPSLEEAKGAWEQAGRPGRTGRGSVWATKHVVDAEGVTRDLGTVTLWS